MDYKHLVEKFSLEGQTALITGAGRGIGRGLAIALARAGSSIVVVDINEQNAKQTAEFLRSNIGVNAYSHIADLSKTGMIKDYVKDILGKCGKVDILINNVGIQVRKPALEFTLEEWNSVLNIHLTVSFAMAQAVVPGMIDRGGGKIINIASIHNSHPATAAVATAVREKSRLAHAVRFLHQISKCIAASVRHADATMDQMTVTQLMFRFSPG